MRIAISQMNAIAGDFEATKARMVEQSKVASGKGADLLVFPSTVLTGASGEGIYSNEAFKADLEDTISDLSQKLEVPALVPFAFSDGMNVVQEVAVMLNGSSTPLRASGCLELLSTEHDLDPSAVANALRMPATFDLGDVSLGVAFDYGQVGMFASEPGAVDAIIYLPSDPFVAADERTALAASIPLGCYVRDAAHADAWLVAVNPVGGFDDLVYTGGSFVLAPWGELAWTAPVCEESFGIVEVDLSSEGPLPNPVTASSISSPQMLWRALELSLRDYVQKAGGADVALMLDGSLGSSATAVLAVDSLGPRHVHALVVPTRGAETLGSARELAGNLRIDAQELDADVLHAAASSLAGTPTSSCDADLERGLAEARLASVAKAHDAFVLADVDKTTVALGPLHLPPDAAFAPFADVYRSDVIEMAHERQAVSPVFPTQTLAAIDIPEGFDHDGSMPPSQFLSQVEAICYLHVEHGLSLSELDLDGPKVELASAILSRIRATEVARRNLPVFSAVSECAFDMRRWPVGLAWHDKVRPLADLTGHESSLVNMIQALLGSDEPSIAEDDDLRDQERDAIGFLRDIADGGGLDAGAGDLWGTGMFSDN